MPINQKVEWKSVVVLLCLPSPFKEALVICILELHFVDIDWLLIIMKERTKKVNEQMLVTWGLWVKKTSQNWRDCPNQNDNKNATGFKVHESLEIN